MGRDYVARNRKPAAKAAGLPGWVWAVAGLSIGLGVAAVVYISRPPQPMPMMAGAPAAAVALAAVDPARRAKIPIPPKEDSRFKFYDLLENQQVVIPSSSETAKPNPAAAAAAVENGQYVIVVGSFQQQELAEQSKASLALAGVESRIEKVTIDDKDTWYRVRVGPEKGLTRAQTVLSQLKQSGFDGRVVRLP